MPDRYVFLRENPSGSGHFEATAKTMSTVDPVEATSYAQLLSAEHGCGYRAVLVEAVDEALAGLNVAYLQANG